MIIAFTQCPISAACFSFALMFSLSFHKLVCNFPGRGPRLMSRLWRQNLGLSRLSTPKLGMSRLFRPKHGNVRFCDPDDPSRLSRPERRWRDQNIVTHIWYARTLATESCRFQAFATDADTARPCGSGIVVTGATKLSHFQSFQTQMETARLSRPTWKRRDFKKVFQGFFDRGGDGAT